MSAFIELNTGTGDRVLVRSADILVLEDVTHDATVQRGVRTLIVVRDSDSCLGVSQSINCVRDMCDTNAMHADQSSAAEKGGD